MQSVILYPLNCITAIHNIMISLNPNLYELFVQDKPIDPIVLKFFQARQSVLSWIIFRDGIGSIEIECEPKLVSKLNIIQDTYEEVMSDIIPLYKIIDIHNRVA